MNAMYYVVRYEGPFAFIKPWTAVRDGVTYSQQFLTPSVLEGIEKKLFPELLPLSGLQGKICRYKLRYAAVSVQQEQTQIRGWDYKSKEKRMVRPRSVLKRGVLLKPVLLLAFSTQEDAWRATMQHICLCRNEGFLHLFLSLYGIKFRRHLFPMNRQDREKAYIPLWPRARPLSARCLRIGSFYGE